MRKIFPALSLLLLLTSCSPITPEPVAPTPPPEAQIPVLYLSADGGDNAVSLEQAILTVPEGGRIELGPGIYDLTEPLEINKPLALIGAGMDQTEIRSEAAAYVARFSGMGPFIAEGITFRHEGEAWANTVVVEGGEISFEGCRFAGASEAHLAILGETTGRVQNSVMDGGAGSVGIYVGDQAGPTLQDNDASGNGHGIRVTDQAQPILVGNLCQGNQFDGIRFDGSSGGIARDNECTGNRSGIAVEGQATPLLENNTLSGNSTSGIAYHDSAGGIARGNDCSQNFGGIGVSDTALPTLEDNICSDNQTAGIAYFVGGSGVARRNQCTGNGLHGIGVFDEAAPVLEANILNNNGNSGIAYLGSAGGTAQENECSRNAIGILIEATADPSIEDNSCVGNTSADVTDLRP